MGDRLDDGAVFCFFHSELFYTHKLYIGRFATLYRLSTNLRMRNWQTVKTMKTPLLWSLHLSYFNMGLGYLVLGVSYFTNTVSFSSAIHIITIGTIGTMIIAMMSRVSLGHTGRKLQINGWISFSFLLLLGATLARFLLPVLNWIMPGYMLAATCWAIGFVIFIIYYTPILMTARPDGRSG